MSSESIERALRDLPRTGQLIKDRPYRQIWRIEIEGRAYYLKFYPRLRGAGRIKRLLVGNPALREFARLQWLQKANIPAPRAISALVGFRVSGQAGDAVLMHAIEPGITLDRYFNELELAGKSDSRRRRVAEQITEMVQQLIRARLGHRDLHLGNFLLSGEKVYLLDAYAVRRGRMRKSDLFMLGHSARRYATKTELLRAWRRFGGIDLPAANNRVSRRFWAKEISRITAENAYFGQLRHGDWRGHYFKSRKYPPPWSQVGRLRFSATDWRTEWPRLFGQLQSGQFRAVHETPRHQILSAEIVLAGVPTNVSISRKREQFWRRCLSMLGRQSTSARAWRTAWSLIVRDIPTAWPLLLMERRRFGFVIDQMIVFERMAGTPLSDFALSDSSRSERDRLFHRVGGLLRRLESFGLYHANATASNFLIHLDANGTPAPILMDVDGIRKIRGTRSSIHRLLSSLRQRQKAYNPPDSYALCRGYASAARMEKEA